MSLNDVLMRYTLGGSKWVLYLLIVLSILSVTIMVERTLVLLRTGSDVALLEKAMEAVRPGEALDRVRIQLEPLRGGEAHVLRKSLERADEGPASVEEVIASLSGREKMRLERGVAFLGTVGSNAPFIGLFGTVLGIIKAFHDLSSNRGGGSEVVMSGISEALVATAVGLMVAIPAVMAYNFLQRRIKMRLARLNTLAHLLLAGLKGTPESIAIEHQPIRQQHG